MKDWFKMIREFVKESEVVAMVIVVVIFMLYAKYVHDYVIAWTVSLVLS